MNEKLRKVCELCKAKKYTKFLRRSNGKNSGYVCRNCDKCNNHGANYKK